MILMKKIRMLPSIFQMLEFLTVIRKHLIELIIKMQVQQQPAQLILVVCEVERQIKNRRALQRMKIKMSQGWYFFNFFDREGGGFLRNSFGRLAR